MMRPLFLPLLSGAAWLVLAGISRADGDSAVSAQTAAAKSESPVSPDATPPPTAAKRVAKTAAPAGDAGHAGAESDNDRAVREAREQLAEAQKMADFTLSAQAPAAASDMTSNSETWLVTDAAGSSSSTTSVTHHTMDELVISAHHLGPHLSDPTHNTMDALVAARHLRPDPSDPKHHTMGELQ